MRIAAAAIVCGLLATFPQSAPAEGREETALDRYVAAPIPTTIKAPEPEQGWTAYFIELTFSGGGPLFIQVHNWCPRRAR